MSQIGYRGSQKEVLTQQRLKLVTPHLLQMHILSERSSNTTKIETQVHRRPMFRAIPSERSSNTTKIETKNRRSVLKERERQKEVLTQQRLKLVTPHLLQMHILSERSSNTTKIETQVHRRPMFRAIPSERSSNTTKIETKNRRSVLKERERQKEVLTQQRLKLISAKRTLSRFVSERSSNTTKIETQVQRRPMFRAIVRKKF